MDLFGNEPEKPKNDHLYRQLERLGEMMGDGLHHEPDGAWISREYKAVSKTLFPDMHSEATKAKNKAVDAQMGKLLSENKCACGGQLRQVRSGSKVSACIACSQRYRTIKKK